MRSNRLANASKKARLFLYVLRCWFKAAPYAFFWITIGMFVKPRKGLELLHNVLHSLDCYSNDPMLGSVNVTDVIKGNADVKIIGQYHIHKKHDTRMLLELSTLAYLMQALKPKVVFEIGTFVGRSARLFAVNSPDNTKIFTLDLPQNKALHRIGEDYIGTAEAKKITQLFGDSRSFDYSKWYKQCDFVWVDACHDYAFVKSDTDKALKLCRDGGWIGWHDYRHSKSWDGVTRCVKETYKNYHYIHHIYGTTIVIMQKKTDIACQAAC